jgi:uncharacterized protein
MASKKIIVDCPKCGRKTEFSPANAWRPFCSQRCKTGDLGAWASDQYVVSGNSLESSTEDDPHNEPRREPNKERQ